MDMVDSTVKMDNPKIKQEADSFGNSGQAIRSKRQQCSLNYALDVIQQSPVFPYIKALYLFGSCARREENYKSDVDLLMELHTDFPQEEPSMRRELVRLRGDVSPTGAWDPEVDLKITTGDGWKLEQSLFYENIRKDAKLIWE